MTRASQGSDYILRFGYTTNTVGLTNKIKNIYEEADVGNNTSNGGSITFSYGHNETTIQDKSGHTNIYQFNYWGNTVCIQDDQGNASFASFNNNYYDHQNENNIANQNKKNQLDVSSQLQNTVGNRLRYRCPSVWNDYWGKLSGYTTGTISTPTFGHTSTKSIAMTIPTESSTPCVLYNFEDNLYANPGETFTFSLYVNTKDVTDEDSKFYIALGLDFQEASYSNYVETAIDEWKRVEVTYKYTGTARARLTPYIVFDGVGTVYVDSMQFEEGKSAGRLNLASNSDVSYDGTSSALYNWVASSTTYVKRVDISSAITGGKSATELLDNHCLKLIGNPGNSVTASQIVTISGQANDSYVFAGWAKGDSAPLTDNRTFGIKVEFLNGTTVINSSSISFNPDMDSTNNWQYAAGAAVADGDYTSIKITLLYDYNVNVAYFDGIQLYKETFGSSFTYDDDGNVVSTVDANKAETEYEYENNDLTAMVLPDDSRYEYTYDDYHNVKTATTPTGTVYSFEYDVYGNNTKVSVGTINNLEQMVVSATYLDSNLNCFDGAFLTSITDTAGNITTYGYDTEESLLLWVKAPNDTDATRTEYTYDDQYRVISTSKKVGQDTAIVGSTFTVDLLSVLTHTNNSEEDTTAYAFAYGKFDLLSSISIGGDVLASYTYNNLYERYLSALTYGNGDSIEYDYDDKGRTSSVTYDDNATPSLNYTYDQAGRLIKVEDLDANTVTTYKYDLTNRLMKYEVKDNASGTILYATEYTYNKLNNLESLREIINGVTFNTGYMYDQNNRLTEFSRSHNTSYDVLCQLYTYDDLGRFTGYTTQENFGNIVTTTLGYKAPKSSMGTTATTVLSQWINNYGNTTSGYYYQIDGNGNITEISPDNNFADSNGVEYSYDSLDQLIRVDDGINGETWTYTYDLGGNILSKSRYAYSQGTLGTALETISYGYGDASWGDLLTNYNGNSITYDQIGNPLSDGTWDYTWEHGRQLESQSNGTTTWDYSYDAGGQRTTRTNGTLTYHYIYDGIQLKYLEILQNNTTVCEMYFEYGQTGLVAIQYISSSLTDTYYVVTNAQGDVVALVDGIRTEVVSYTYDAWGQLISVTGSMANTLGQYNPIRYRGYVYDTETELYYLNTRYYNPEWGRFINADGYTSTGQGLTAANNFAYCGNNPVTRVDYSGCFWDTIFDVASLVLSVVDVVANPTDPWAWAGLVGDIVDVAVPFVAGVGEVTRAVKTANKVADVVDTTHDIAKTANRVENVIDTSANGIRYTDKVIKQMNNAADLNHAFPSVIDTFVDINSGRPLKGGDGIIRNLIELPGSINNTPGVFEYIIEPNGMCNHRYFRNLR